MLTGVSFASWVLGSDVVVAQTGQTLAVWYNVDAPEVATLIPVRGDAIDIVREDGRTSITVEEVGGKVAYLLDESLIEFGTALHDNDFGKALLFLEDLADRPQAEAMWENVARNAMAARQLLIAARCYAALGDVACSRYIYFISYFLIIILLLYILTYNFILNFILNYNTKLLLFQISKKYNRNW